MRTSRKLIHLHLSRIRKKFSVHTTIEIMRCTGETLACGTGCCATAVACVLNGLTDDEITVKLLGGELHIRWDRKANLVYMTGPAKIVFEGEVDPDSI